jgi:cellulase/cellobiase CelA1
LNNNQTFNNTGFPENSNKSSPSHVILNMEGAASASSKPSVIVKDGVKYKVAHILEINPELHE